MQIKKYPRRTGKECGTSLQGGSLYFIVLIRNLAKLVHFSGQLPKGRNEEKIQNFWHCAQI
jgi:hypothetical protein